METVCRNVNTKYNNAYQLSKEEKGPFFAKMQVPSSHFQGYNTWILKATGFNRGFGIHVFNKLEDLHSLIKDYTEGTFAEVNMQGQTPKNAVKADKQQEGGVPAHLKSTSFVIQKYVERPLLILNRKFDIRVWVLVTQD